VVEKQQKKNSVVKKQQQNFSVVFLQQCGLSTTATEFCCIFTTNLLGTTAPLPADARMMMMSTSYRKNKLITRVVF
jgi:hypothetical protein